MHGRLSPPKSSFLNQKRVLKQKLCLYYLTMPTITVRLSELLLILLYPLVYCLLYLVVFLSRYEVECIHHDCQSPKGFVRNCGYTHSPMGLIVDVSSMTSTLGSLVNDKRNDDVKRVALAALNILCSTAEHLTILSHPVNRLTPIKTYMSRLVPFSAFFSMLLSHLC